MCKIRHLTLLLVSVTACICTAAFCWVLYFQNMYSGHARMDLCYTPSLVNETGPCVSCVHFVSFFVADSSRWNRFNDFVRALRVTGTTLRKSQNCFRLNLYTNLAIDGTEACQLIQAGGAGVEVQALPKLPANRYTNKSRWLAFSCSKRDLVEHYATLTGVDPVWIDMDTLVVTDISRAVGRARNFVVNHGYPKYTIVGPQGPVLLHPQRSVNGDLAMMDSSLRNAVRALEKAACSHYPMISKTTSGY